MEAFEKEKKMETNKKYSTDVMIWIIFHVPGLTEYGNML